MADNDDNKIDTIAPQNLMVLAGVMYVAGQWICHRFAIKPADLRGVACSLRSAPPIRYNCQWFNVESFKEISLLEPIKSHISAEQRDAVINLLSGGRRA